MKALLAVCTLFVACDASYPRTLGLDEPIRVRGAQFVSGDLPTGGTTPAVTNINVAAPAVLPGQAGKAISGRASGDASAVGVRFVDMGSGYWVVPMGAPDVQFPGELTWQTVSDFNLLAANLPGHHTLRYVAFDANGKAGASSDVTLCLDPLIPDNGATCDPTAKPPAAVLTLTFDADADVDLAIVGPDGRRTDSKHPATILPDAGVIDPTSGVMDRDSLANCVPDARRQEDIVWKVAPATGTVFDVYASLFDACHQPGVSYVVTMYRYDTGAAVAVQSAKGVFTTIDATGGTTVGTYLFSYSF